VLFRSVISECAKKLEAENLEQFADSIMQLILQVFTIQGAIAHEDAFLALGYIADKLGESFEKYLPYVKDPIVIGLKNFEDYAVCTCAIGFVGDLCRALKIKIAPICDEIMGLALEILNSPSVHRSVKPHTISLFADVALAVEGNFERYASVVFAVLQSAGQIQLSTEDEDEIEYVELLRGSILEAYTGIIQGFKDSKKQDVATPYLESITTFMKLCATGSEEMSDDILSRLVGLIGDLGQAYGSKMAMFFSDPSIIAKVQEASGSDDSKIRELSKWAHHVMMSRK